MNKDNYNCLHCGAENKFKGYSYANKYCDNQCQGNARRANRIDEWITHGKAWNETLSIPKWAREYITSIYGHKCSVCEITDWQGMPVVFDIDHIDGDHTSNKPENLRLLCQNCHAQTSTYKNRNVGHGRTNRNK